MLVLSRKKEESIIIDGYIEVQVLEVIDGKVKLGIKAPRNVEILRKEVYTEIQEENKHAISNSSMVFEMKNIGKIFKK